MAQQGDGRAVGPVEVVEHEQQRCALRRDPRASCSPTRTSDTARCRARRARARGDRGTRSAMSGTSRASRVPLRTISARTCGGVAIAHDVLDRLDERLIRDHVLLVAASVQHGRALVVQLAGQLGGDAGSCRSRARRSASPRAVGRRRPRAPSASRSVDSCSLRPTNAELAGLERDRQREPRAVRGRVDERRSRVRGREGPARRADGPARRARGPSGAHGRGRAASRPVGNRSATSSAVACESSTWPPRRAHASRAVRLSAVPK